MLGIDYLVIAAQSVRPVEVNVPPGDPLWATAVVAVVSALLGAVVGGYSSFRAAEALETKRRLARTMIRRKAKIYTPIRAELVEFRDAMERRDHLGVWGVQRQEPTVRTMRPAPVLWRWAEMTDDGRAATSASTVVRERLDAVEEAADRFSGALAAGMFTVKSRAEAILASLGGSPAVVNWVHSDIEHIVSGDFDNSHLLGGGLPGVTSSFNRRDEFVAQWERDAEAQSAVDAITKAESELSDAVREAIRVLDAAMKRIADNYENESPVD
jgi:hypothetical protein